MFGAEFLNAVEDECDCLEGEVHLQRHVVYEPIGYGHLPGAELLLLLVLLHFGAVGAYLSLDDLQLAELDLEHALPAETLLQNHPVDVDEVALAQSPALDD